MATPRKTPTTKTNFAKKDYKPLPACGSLDTPYKIRSLMRRVISHQLKGEIGSTAHSAINGSAGLALKTLQQGEFEERVALLEEKLTEAMDALDGATSGKGKKKKHKKKSKRLQCVGIPG